MEQGEELLIGPKVSKRICKIVFQKHHEDLRKYLNVHAILPHLNSHSLLSPSLDQCVVTSNEVTVESKVDTIILSWLPKSESSDYLSPFIECLRVSADQAGDAHTDLADDLEKTRDEELRKWNCECPLKVVLPPFFILLLLLTLLCVVCLILTLAVLPASSKTPVKQLVTSPSTTIPLNSLTNLWWLYLAFINSSCSGEVAVVRDTNCSELPKTEAYYDSREVDFALWYLYAIEGSEINFTLPADKSDLKADSPHIWITHTLEAFKELDEQLKLQSGGSKYACDHAPPDSTCYSTGDYVDSDTDDITFRVPAPGYYSYTLTDSSDSSGVSKRQYGIEWTVLQLNYNFTAITDENSGFPILEQKKFLKENSPLSFRLSEPFDFTSNCALVKLACASYYTLYSFTMDGFKVRWDTAVVVLVVYISCVLVLMTSFLTPCLICKLISRLRK